MKVASKLSWVLKADAGAAATVQIFIFRIFILATNMATGVIIARSLGAEGRGILVAITLFPNVLGVLMGLALPTSLLYNLRRYPKQRSDFFSAAFLLGCLTSVVSIITGIIIAPYWLSQYTPQTIRMAQWFMLAIPIATLPNFFATSFKASGQFLSLNQLYWLPELVKLFALITCLSVGVLDTSSAALIYILAGLPIYIVQGVYIFQSYRPRLHFKSAIYRRLLDYGMRSYGSTLFSQFELRVDQFLAASMLTPSQLGIYAVALSLSRILKLFQTSVMAVLLSKIAARPIQEVIEITAKATRLTVAATFLAGLPIVLLGELVLKLLYGPEFVEAALISRILCFEIILQGSNAILFQSFMAVDRPGVVTLGQAVGLTVLIPLILFLTPLYGLTGLGVSVLIGSIAKLVFIIFYYKIVFDLHIPSMVLKKTDIKFVVSILKNAS